ncbi:MAG: hypothetical protein WCR07_06685 [Verrucomicrobiota bacterium]
MAGTRGLGMGRVACGVVAAAAWLAAPEAARAQVTTVPAQRINVTPGQLVPAIGVRLVAPAAGAPAVVEAVAVGSEAGPGTVEGRKASASPEDARVQRLLQTRFDRRPTGMLRAMAGRAAAGGGLPETNEVVRLKRWVETSDWKGLGGFLATVPTNRVGDVFLHVVRGLQQVGDGRPAMGGSEEEEGGTPEGIMQGGAAGRAEPYALPDDVLGLAAARPGILQEAELLALGQLLARASAKGHDAEGVLSGLEEGAGSLGGKEREGRLRAAKLLFAAGRGGDAGRFLPPVEGLKGTNDLPLMAMHAQSMAAGGRDDESRASLKKAWEVNLTIVRLPGATLEARREALGRMLQLWPQARTELGEGWLRGAFGREASEGLLVLAAVAEVVARDATQRDVEKRSANLALQRQVVGAVLEAMPRPDVEWRTALNLVAAAWLQEAQLAAARHRPRMTRGQQFDPYGNPIFFGGDMEPQMQNPGQLPALTVEQALESAPDGRWLGVLDASVLPRMHGLLADLRLKAEDDDAALKHVEALAALDRERATAAANQFLAAWTRIHDPNPPVRNMMPRYFFPGGQMPTGIPLTRALQARNLGLLAGAMERLRRLNVALNDEQVVAAFAMAHSPAEVFRAEDIARVLGPVGTMSPGTLAGMLQAMRERLAGPWRQARVQQDAKTRRTDKEIEAEVMRGYEVLAGMVDEAVSARPDEWRLRLVQGVTRFDRAEFDYGRKVELKEYTRERDEAFKAMQGAAALYASRVEGMREGERSAAAFLQWFNATLGASDLAYLTRQQEPDTNHLAKVRSALMGLPGSVRDAHLAEFGRAVTAGLSSIKPELKARYLRAGLAVAGEHASMAEVRKVVRHYDDLLDEVLLDVRVDGPAEVGHGSPFGVHVALRYTEAVGRESGNFSKYLQNQQRLQNFYNPYGTPPVNYREDFEKHLRTTWDKNFEVLAVTFHDERVEPRGLGKPGWRETPYAYVLLKAKDASVDRLPSLRMDLDFVDRHGAVILPVASSVQMLDARAARGAARPLAGVECVQVLDDREASEGRLGLEIKATGQGLLPELDELLDLSLEGYRVERKPGAGLALLRVEAGGDVVAPVTERTLLLALTPEPGKEAPRSFRFPGARHAGTTNVFKRYADADLESVNAEVALASLRTTGFKPLGWAIGAGVALVLGAGLWGLRRGPAAPEATTPRHPLPERCTPFTTLRYLQRIQGDAPKAWAPERRTELAAAIRDLEARYFGPGQAGTPDAQEPGLDEVARRWATLAG